MKIVHWTEKALPSGLGETALHICEAERKMGLDSITVDAYKEDDWHQADDADVHVIHLYMPLKYLYGSKKPKVWVAHGTPDLMFEAGYTESTKGQYGSSDSWMICHYWIQNADVIVTFWPRHEAIWRSLSDKNTRIEGIPLGVDLDFWKPLESQGKFAGEPSVFSAENCYTLKWPYDLLIAWPWVIQDGLPDAKLHLVNVPFDQSRVWFPLIDRNGAGFHTYLTNRRFSFEELRNAFCSTDLFCGLVRYGDMNYLALQANACGMKTVSYRGNPYSSYHVDAGDQRIIAQQLTAILKGQVEERIKEPVPPLSRTAERMKEIYLSLANDTPTGLLQPKRRKKAPIAPQGESLATLTVQ